MPPDSAPISGWPIIGFIRTENKACRTAILGLCCLTLLGACDGRKTAAISQPAPEISATRLDGNPVRLADFDGRAVIVYFWLGGCAACITELPALQEIRGRYDEADVAILPINVGGNPEIVREFNKSSGGIFESAIDDLSLTATHFEVAVFPTTFVLDRNQIVREKIRGALSVTEIGQILSPIL